MLDNKGDILNQKKRGKEIQALSNVEPDFKRLLRDRRGYFFFKRRGDVLNGGFPFRSINSDS